MIPRPATTGPGGPAPWLLAAAADITLTGVRDGLTDAGMLLSQRPAPLPVTGGAAVLVPLFEEKGEARVVLTRRAATLRSHRDQVCFPGGRIEPGEDAVPAALREAFEEIALDPSLVAPVGLLHPVRPFTSRVPITPVVATLGSRPAVVANPAEVARVFDVSLADLAASYVEERWTEPGRPTFSMYLFEVATETVWGATARMLVDLLTLVLVR